MFLGIDIGSSSSKAVIMDAENRIISTAVINTGTGTHGPEKAVASALSQADLEISQIAFTVVTGYGRITYEKADKQITEISCHGKGAAFLAPQAKTIIDIGGQDAKVIRIDTNGKIENFVMNEKCAAGTGRFLEVMARILEIEIGELSALASRSAKEITISSTCTVFAESEVISQLAADAAKADVAQGVHRSVAKRVSGLALRIGIRPAVVMTGGVALNDSMVATLSQEIGQPVCVVPLPQMVGAVGAALYAAEAYKKTKG
ncbi:MAG: acyl-CoA dehydratase activase [Anaerolineaceae bacterium]|nr:acyl-CoA dehydratase activase [Anaerolineaceae bacterium]